MFYFVIILGAIFAILITRRRQILMLTNIVCKNCGHFFIGKAHSKMTSQINGKFICAECYEEEKIEIEVQKGLRCADCKTIFTMGGLMGGVVHPETNTKLCFTCFEKVSDKIRVENEIKGGVRCPECESYYSQSNPKVRGLDGEIICNNCYVDQVRKAQEEQQIQEQRDIARAQEAQRAANKPSLKESFMSGYNSVDKSGNDIAGKINHAFWKNVALNWECLENSILVQS